MNTSNAINGTSLSGDTIGEGHVSLVVYVTSCIIVLFEFTSNALVIFILSTRKTLRKKRYTVLVMSLGVADFVISLAGLLWLLSQRIDPQSVYLCGSMLVLFTLGTFMSVYFTFVISLNRYLTATNTTWNNRMYGGGRKYALMYIPSAAIAAVSLVFTSAMENSISSCSVENMFGASMPVFSAFVTVMFLPFLFCTIICYALAMRAICKRFGQVHPQVAVIQTTHVAESNPPDFRKSRKMAALKTTGVLIALIMVGTAPFLLSFSVSMMQIEVSKTVRVVLAYGLYVNSAINPIIYTWRLQELRLELWKVFCRSCST